MAYRAIYRKWRPIVFEDVVGQKHITDTLKNEIITNKTAHAYLFCGTRGTGKTTTAKILSRAVNCENPLPDGNPCNQCSACKGILNNSVMDVIEIDAASNNGVDNIRELRDDVIYTPAEVKYKVYIIDEVHMLSGGAFNALLKTLEEPPAHVLFILATTEPHKIPATIQSRCQRFDFRRISASNIAGRVAEIASKDGIKISDEAVRLVAELGDGSMRDALSVLDLCTGIDGEISVTDIENVTGAVSKKFLYEITSSALGGNISVALSSLNSALINGREVTAIADDLLGFLRELLICKFSEDAQDILDKTKEVIARYKQVADSIETESLVHSIGLLSETIYALKTSSNQRAVLEAALVKMAFPQCDNSSNAFAARIKRLEEGVPVKVETPKAQTPVPPPPVYEEPPFDIPEPIVEEIKPEPIKEQPKVVEPAKEPDVKIEGEHVNLKDKIFTQAPYLRILGEKVEFIKQNETMLVVCETKVDSDNGNIFIKDIENICGCKVRLTYKGEFDINTQSDPFDELLSKANDFEQINLL